MNASWLQLPALAIGAPIRLVDVARYQAELESLSGGRLTSGTVTNLLTVELRPEPTNTVDPQAIIVLAAGMPVAYVPRDQTAAFHPVIQQAWAAGGPATCRASMTGGWDRGGGDRGHIGIQLLCGEKPRLLNVQTDAFLPESAWLNMVAFAAGAEAIAALAGKRKTTLAVLWASVPKEPRIMLYTGSTWVGEVSSGAISPRTLGVVRQVQQAGLPPTCSAQILRQEDGSHTFRVKIQHVDSEVDRKYEARQLAFYAARRRPPTGRWYCNRCDNRWATRGPIPEDWTRLKEGPHVCPECGSYGSSAPA